MKDFLYENLNYLYNKATPLILVSKKVKSEVTVLLLAFVRLTLKFLLLNFDFSAVH